MHETTRESSTASGASSQYSSSQPLVLSTDAVWEQEDDEGEGLPPTQYAAPQRLHRASLPPVTPAAPPARANTQRFQGRWFKGGIAAIALLAVLGGFSGLVVAGLTIHSELSVHTPVRRAAHTPRKPGTVPPTSPTAVIAQDTFARPDQALWGTASDGHEWVADANVLPNFAVVGHVGQITGGGQGIFQAALGPESADAEVLVSGSLTHFQQAANLGAVLRWTDTNHWYKAYVDGTQLILIKDVAGTITRLAAVPFVAADGQAETLRFRMVGSQLSAKAWLTGHTEPGTWMVMATDHALTAGFGGLRLVLPAVVVASITLFRETTVSIP